MSPTLIGAAAAWLDVVALVGALVDAVVACVVDEGPVELWLPLDPHAATAATIANDPTPDNILRLKDTR